MLRHLSLIAVLGVVLLALQGCQRRDRGGEDYDRPLPPGADGIVLLPEQDYPRFSLRDSKIDGLLQGIDNSLTYLGKPSSHRHFPIAGVSHADVHRGLERFRELITSGIDDSELNRRIRAEFDVYTSVGWNGRGDVLFTGYYTPIFDASLERTTRFRYPLYKRPDDLVGGGAKEMARQQLPNGRTRPYPTRKEIEQSNMLAGHELLWLADPFEAYTIQVQGSAQLRLRNGSMMKIGYAGTNGHDYTSVGQELIADGRIDKGQLSLKGLMDFFAANPDMFDTYTWRNDRYVFFQRTDGGPYGSLGQPVTPDVSIATDKSIFPRAALVFVTTDIADGHKRIRPYSGFRLDQDTGGAIRAPGRCDLYMGTGAHAERRAGYQLAEGRMYYLVAK